MLFCCGVPADVNFKLISSKKVTQLPLESCFACVVIANYIDVFLHSIHFIPGNGEFLVT